MIRISARRAASTLGAVALSAAALLGTAAPASAATVPAEDRAYTVKVTTLKAFDETGSFNSLLSDEIYGGFRTTFASGVRSNVGTRLFGNFDAGDTRTVPTDQNCLSVPLVQVNNGRQDNLSGHTKDRWSCATIGINAPFTVTGALWESDTDLPEIPFEFNPRGEGDVLDSRARDGQDDSLGTPRLSFSTTGLAVDFPTIGPVKNYTSDFRGGGAHYRVTYQVQRVF
jgi:hypothetical protein